MKAAEYKNIFQNLNVNRSGDSVAPHKAILLLSIIELIEDGVIRSPFIPLNDRLERTFKNTWTRYVPITSIFSCKLQYPFFHLSSSSFWKLEKIPTYEERKEYSMAALKRSFSGATISSDLFTLLCQPQFRDEIKTILINTYLTNSSSTLDCLKGLVWASIGLLVIAWPHTPNLTPIGRLHRLRKIYARRDILRSVPRKAQA